jgi:hypothetical protein
MPDIASQSSWKKKETKKGRNKERKKQRKEERNAKQIIKVSTVSE